MKELVIEIVKALVDQPDEITVTEIESSHATVFERKRVINRSCCLTCSRADDLEQIVGSQFKLLMAMDLESIF